MASNFENDPSALSSTGGSPLDHAVTGDSMKPSVSKLLAGTGPDDPYALYRARTDGGHYIDTSQPALPTYHRKFASPTPLGLLAFSSSTFILSMFNVSARGVKHPGLAVACAVATGGFGQMVAGIWEFACGNTFSATSLCMYATFWWSYAIFQIPFFGIVKSVPEDELVSSIGIFLAAWFIVTFILFLATLRSTIALALVLFFLLLTFATLMAFYFTGVTAWQTAGGAFGLCSSVCGFWTSTSTLLNSTSSYFVLPLGDLHSGSKLDAARKA